MGGYYVIMADIIRVEHPHPALDEVKKNEKKSYVFWCAKKRRRKSIECVDDGTLNTGYEPTWSGFSAVAAASLRSIHSPTGREMHNDKRTYVASVCVCVCIVPTISSAEQKLWAWRNGC